MGSDPGRRIAVLISGRGSNLQAIIDAVAGGRLRARIAVVISNRAAAYGLERARAAGIETLTISHREYPTRDGFEEVLVRELRARDVSLVCLAGFMRLLGRTFLDAFPNGILNIHPSLLPSFAVHDDDTAETLAARILDEEHRIYPEAIAIVLDGGWTIDGRRFKAPAQAGAGPGHT